MPDYAVVALYGSERQHKKWERVLPGSVTRHGDGTLTFKRLDNDGKFKRVTIYGHYSIEYPFDQEDK